jgi:exosortase A-associated hydrolase 1
MDGIERPIVFDCQGCRLIGVLHRPRVAGPRGVLIIVGGPQTRIGSHRQFLLLARALAERDIPVFRFDYRGMGDSEGDFLGFEHIADDISAALDTFTKEVGTLREVVLWGLCDAASAAMINCSRDKRIRGLVLANPWVRSDTGLAVARLRHYYGRRFFSRELWRKVLAGKFETVSSVKSFISTVLKACGDASDKSVETSPREDAAVDFIERMRRGLEKFEGEVLFILSGDDLTASEFRDLARSGPWRRLIKRRTTRVYEYPESNHTFSSQVWRDQVAVWTVQWLESW